MDVSPLLLSRISPLTSAPSHDDDPRNSPTTSTPLPSPSRTPRLALPRPTAVVPLSLVPRSLHRRRRRLVHLRSTRRQPHKLHHPPFLGWRSFPHRWTTSPPRSRRSLNNSRPARPPTLRSNLPVREQTRLHLLSPSCTKTRNPQRADFGNGRRGRN